VTWVGGIPLSENLTRAGPGLTPIQENTGTRKIIRISRPPGFTPMALFRILICFGLRECPVSLFPHIARVVSEIFTLSFYDGNPRT